MWRPQRSEIGAKASTKNQTSAVKRLLQDIKYIRENPIPTVGVVALPLEKDLFVWHCNIRGPKGTPYEGGVFHLVLNFPASYPYDPPKVTVCTTLQHPNVIGSSLCLDMLQPGDEQEKYIGWSSAYSVQSILIQLQAFLFEESPTIRVEDCRKAVETANVYTCPTCKHKPLRSWPPFPSYEQESFVLLKSERDLIREELVCFHSKRSFTEDTLGFGISFNKNIRTGDVQTISSPLDLLGIRAFMREGIRKSSINEPFTHWLPVYIDDEHGKKAMHLAERSLSLICASNPKEFKPHMVFNILPKLMSTMVAQIMKGQIHASIKALEGYCAFHQLFLKFLERYPQLVDECKKQVTDFLKDETNRHKDKVPSLGEFLCYLTVVPEVTWNDISSAVVQESFDRQVLWTLKDYPQLGKEEEDPAVDKIRANVTFEASIVGMRLIMFSYYFLEHVARPLGKTIAEMSAKYSYLYGRPSSKMCEDMQQAFREIKKVKSYNDFFARVGLPTIPDEELLVRLRQSVSNSRRRQYHGVEGPRVPSPEELAQESLKRVVPLDTLTVEAEGGKKVLHANEEKWKDLCNTRWGFNALPADYPADWKNFYLQNNLQDLVTTLNNNPDFKSFYHTLELSADHLSILDLTLFQPSKIKSGFHFLTGLLSRLRNLKELKIRRGTDGGLGLKGCRALVKGLKNNRTSLRILNLSYSDIQGYTCAEVLTEGLLASQNLEQLNLEGNNFSGGMKALSRLLWEHRSLTRLDMSNCSINSDGAKDLADGLLANKQLRFVNLSKNPLGYAGLKAVVYNLAFSPTIQDLDLSRIELSYSSSNDAQELAEALSKLFRITVTLRNFNLWKTRLATSFTAPVIEALGQNRSVTDLDLGDVGSISSAQLGSLGKALTINKSLASLNLEKCQISGSGVETLYTSLFRDKQDREQAALSLAEIERQRKERRRAEMLDTVKAVEKEFHFNLIELNLNDNSLADGGKILGKVVVIANSLEKLYLENCSLNAAAGETLGLALETNTRLRTIKLRHNRLGKEGAKLLAAGLRSNNTLEVLDLSGNGIGVSGARALAKTLATNSSITDLNLFGNLIDVDGARDLAKALASNKTLKVLDVGLNRIRDKGALAISSALAGNTNLQKVGLKLNFIGDQGALALARAIAKSNISSFALAGNDFEDQTLVAIFDLLKPLDREVEFDLSSRIALMDPERVARTVWVTPLDGKVRKESVKKLFYDAHCGVVLNISIHDHERKASFAKAKYAFVEFAHVNSVSLALDLSSNGKAWIGGQKVRIYRVGTQNKQLEPNTKDKDKEKDKGKDKGKEKAKPKAQPAKRQAPAGRGGRPAREERGGRGRGGRREVGGWAS